MNFDQVVVLSDVKFRGIVWLTGSPIPFLLEKNIIPEDVGYLFDPAGHIVMRETLRRDRESETHKPSLHRAEVEGGLTLVRWGHKTNFEDMTEVQRTVREHPTRWVGRLGGVDVCR